LRRRPVALRGSQHGRRAASACGFRRSRRGNHLVRQGASAGRTWLRAAEPAGGSDHSAVVEVTALIRRVIAARVHDRQLVDDLVQEALTRVMSARQRLEPTALAPYAAVTARNLVASLAATESRNRRHAHRLIDLRKPELPEEELLRREELRAVTTALANLPAPEREALVAHEVEGKRTSWLAASRQSTPGAVATQLSRARARLRVEYLLALEQSEPPTPRCRPVLLALSSGDRRRQRELDAGRHLLDCRFCANLSNQLLDRRRTATATDEVHIPIESDADVVTARKQGRELARKADFSATDLTIIATAISEIARNIVMFAERGEIVVRLVGDGDRRGVTVTARDAGPGIADVEDALEHGTSSYGGLGLGLPGARRLMDEFKVSSEPGKGTTVIMTKWRPGRR
jgi:RNA polymerase sigma factor (sigma-70 family)